jgi:hypothetical protein
MPTVQPQGTVEIPSNESQTLKQEMAFDKGHLTTREELDSLGNFSEWTASLAPELDKTSDRFHSGQDQWAFWINNMRFVCRWHHSDEIQDAEGDVIRRHPTKTVVSDPILIDKSISEEKDEILPVSYDNRTNDPVTRDVRIKETKGESSTITKTSTTNVSIDVSTEIEWFKAAMSASFGESNSNSLTKSDLVEKETTQPIVIKPKTRLIVSQQVVTTTTTKLYEVSIQFLGRNGESTINISTNAGGWAGIGRMCSFSDMGEPIKSRLASLLKSTFAITTVTKGINVEYKEEPLQ